jgi:rhodanese-related sulfurtransferase
VYAKTVCSSAGVSDFAAAILCSKKFVVVSVFSLRLDGQEKPSELAG